jgi:hypothetical protein
MATHGWNGILRYPLMPAAGQTVNGEAFDIPRAADTLTIHVPALVGAAATVKLQTLRPSIDADGTETWTDLRSFAHDAAGAVGTSYPVSAMVESTSVVLYKDEFGAGVLRFVGSEDQSSLPVRIPVVFGF